MESKRTNELRKKTTNAIAIRLSTRRDRLARSKHDSNGRDEVSARIEKLSINLGCLQNMAMAFGTRIT